MTCVTKEFPWLPEILTVPSFIYFIRECGVGCFEARKRLLFFTSCHASGENTAMSSTGILKFASFVLVSVNLCYFQSFVRVSLDWCHLLNWCFILFPNKNYIEFYLIYCWMLLPFQRSYKIDRHSNLLKRLVVEVTVESLFFKISTWILKRVLFLQGATVYRFVCYSVFLCTQKKRHLQIVFQAKQMFKYLDLYDNLLICWCTYIFYEFE